MTAASILPPSSRPARRLLSRALALAMLAALAAGCAGAAAGTGSPPAAAAEPAAGQGARPLAGLRGQRVLLVPVQRVTTPDSLALRAGALDRELGFALGERGLGATWADAAEARRLAAQNPTYASDPSVLPLSRARPLRAGDEVQDPLASQLRALVALHDGRFVVVPTELGVTEEGGTRRAVLHLALVDARGAQVRWAGTTAGVPLDGPAAGLAARIAQQFVDLIAAPPEP